MKRITVGRGNDCDIIIIDETDNVSRHHLVISFNFMGKMKVSDTSSNGTFINGMRMLKGASIPVTKEDKIRLGRNIELDWNLVKDPYRSLRILAVSLLGILIIIGLSVYICLWYKVKRNLEEKENIEIISTGAEIDESWNKDSTDKVAPTITSIDVKDKINLSEKSTSRKKDDEKKVSKPKQKDTVVYPAKDKSELDSIAVF